jgi:hypothetical protein
MKDLREGFADFKSSAIRETTSPWLSRSLLMVGDAVDAPDDLAIAGRFRLSIVRPKAGAIKTEIPSKRVQGFIRALGAGDDRHSLIGQGAFRSDGGAARSMASPTAGDTKLWLRLVVASTDSVN